MRTRIQVKALLAVILGVLLAGAFALPATARTYTYTATTLPGLGFTGHAGSAANDITEGGVAVGYTETVPDSCCSGFVHAVVWRTPTTITDLGTLSGEHGSMSTANGINRNGTVVGWSRGAGPTDLTVAALWRGRSGQRLWTNGVANDISDTGTVVGTRGDKAVEWRRGSLHRLPGLGGASEATAVNADGLVVGWSNLASGERHAVSWRNGRITDLGPGQANDVNRYGVIAGTTPDDGAVTWRGRTERPLGFPGTAQSISDSGIVAGTRPSADDRTSVFVWDHGDVSIAGTDIGADAFGVNDHAVVAGEIGFYPRATLWTP